MLTRGKSFSEDLLFEKDIKKLLRSERRNLKQNQGCLEKGSDSISHNSQSHKPS